MVSYNKIFKRYLEVYNWYDKKVEDLYGPFALTIF